MGWGGVGVGVDDGYTHQLEFQTRATIYIYLFLTKVLDFSLLTSSIKYVKGKNGGGGGQKGRWDPTDDGSEAKAVDGIADKGDPNYDSEADEHDNNYVLVRACVRDGLGFHFVLLGVIGFFYFLSSGGWAKMNVELITLGVSCFVFDRFENRVTERKSTLHTFCCVGCSSYNTSVYVCAVFCLRSLVFFVLGGPVFFHCVSSPAKNIFLFGQLYNQSTKWKRLYVRFSPRAFLDYTLSNSSNVPMSPTLRIWAPFVVHSGEGGSTAAVSVPSFESGLVAEI